MTGCAAQLKIKAMTWWQIQTVNCEAVWIKIYMNNPSYEWVALSSSSYPQSLLWLPLLWSVRHCRICNMYRRVCVCVCVCVSVFVAGELSNTAEGAEGRGREGRCPHETRRDADEDRRHPRQLLLSQSCSGSRFRKHVWKVRTKQSL